MAVVEVSGNTAYDVIIDHGLNNQIVEKVRHSGAHKVAIITQTSVDKYALALEQACTQAGFSCFVWEIPDAEDAKTLQVAGELWDKLGTENFSRTDLIIGLGGGAATDLAGFVAACWMRGIKVIQVPTTLLAMVDAAVGGKTGINTAAGKNLVGCFHEPAAVFIDLDFLNTLPTEELIAGSAEIIKTGFIADEEILRRYEQDPAACLRVDGFLPELIQRSVIVKARVVSQDLKESSLREILNYGHTFGHAVELYENFSWRHGRAVAVGMMFVANLAYQRGLIDDALLRRHSNILKAVGLPTSYAQDRFDELYTAMTRDKKNRDGAIRFVAITEVGQTTRIENPSVAELDQAYQALAPEK
ncbi:3-dehydroquinate synthase [Corynebacterium kutscheri]|uniref:3-dehydroquinate synthase n=1 Tax=Corynebacterium kutscheri TaxID=35755 RepID=A0A0F6QZR2_9CORY|nr:3-dehydroquinate synthase [Corynebacterium kutscheri]AKE41317.1 3-dehydroquinate synthase [Corynebacterium kutscheri]VEH08593.1 3-dehydroquinate synthase [Corynebacterium kutscheri]VEH09639.1 3-dehydroquinate synthase [Corynebacterium kutscheri]VEH79722.1 3-dehydroquinate synthase [Corynebacterium kutscheri]